MREIGPPGPIPPELARATPQRLVQQSTRSTVKRTAVAGMWFMGNEILIGSPSRGDSVLGSSPPWLAPTDYRLSHSALALRDMRMDVYPYP